MIALFFASRGSGEPRPTFYTVPWSPLIERRGELPGTAWRMIVEVLRAIVELGLLKDFYELIPEDLTPEGCLAKDDKLSSLFLIATLELIRELRIVPRPEPATFVHYVQGDTVRISCPHGKAVDARAEIVSPSGKTLVLQFTGEIDGNKGMIALHWDPATGRFRDPFGSSFTVRRPEPPEARA